MKKLLLLMFLLMTTATMYAQEQNRKHFDPAKFEAELENFVTAEAKLSEQETAKFLPIYREMRKKQMENFGKRQQARQMDWNDEQACAEAIRQHDKNEIRQKVIQKTYHEKFLEVLTATKVIRIIRAEDKFHRQAMHRVTNRRQK